MEFVGRRVRREFNGAGVLTGIVKSYDSSTGFFEIMYEDGNSEVLEFSAMASLMQGIVEDQPGAQELTMPAPGDSPRQMKRRRFEIRGHSGNDSASLLGTSCLNHGGDEVQEKNVVGPEGFAKTPGAELWVGENPKDAVFINRNLDISASSDGVDSHQMLNLNDELNLNDWVNSNHGLDLNVGLNLDDGFNLDEHENENLKRINLIDLNVALNEEDNSNSEQDDLGVSVVGAPKIKHCFDFNVGSNDEAKNSDDDCGGLSKEISCSRLAEETHIGEIGGNAEGQQIECRSMTGISRGVSFEIIDEIPVKQNTGSTENLLGNLLPKADSDSHRSFKRNATFGVLDANFVHDGCSSEIQVTGLSDAGTFVLHEYQGNLGSMHEGSHSQKRRKLSGFVNPTTETVLRRSSRTGSEDFSSQIHVSSAIGLDTVNDKLSSPAVAAASEEKLTVSGHEKSEEHDNLPPKLQLPPSSENLNLDGIPILNLFSVYTFLRSFSTLLFLSPFELEDFVAALRCKATNLLFDFIHVSLLQILRTHLEFLSHESAQYASHCLRGLNWELLDLITWPIFMVEYLLIHSSEQNRGLDICHLKVFETDYYKQPESVKIEILQSLCDDVIEVEAIKSELNRRALGTEDNMDFDRNVKFDISQKRRAVMDVSGSSCLTEDADETTDWNSNECCLCKMDGNLICCDGCPAAFHSKCVGVAASLLPEGDWYCPECIIEKDRPWMRIGKSIRGAELLGIDPYGRLYYSSCGYLLVSDSCDTETLFRYYHRNDFTVVIEALKSWDILYSTILSAITKLYNATAIVNGAKRFLDPQNVTPCLDFLMRGHMPATPLLPLLSVPSETSVKDETDNQGKPKKNKISTYTSSIRCEVSGLVKIDSVNVNQSMKVENPLASSERSAEISQAITAIQNFQKSRPDCLNRSSDCLNRSAGILDDSEIPGKHASVGDCTLTSTNLEVEQGKTSQSADHGCTLSKISTIGDTSQRQCGTSYVNYYSFARIASSVAQELMCKSSNKISDDSARSVEQNISAHMKVISSISTEFCWSNIHNLNVDARKEKCGWCISCKAPDDDRDCLFIINDTGPVQESFTSELLGTRSRKNMKGHLIDVICHILCIEDRLHGLLLGPWMNPHYSKLWRKCVLKAFDIASVKHLLLMLESNLRRLALSAEWLKHVDTVATMGSASHVVTKFFRASTKLGTGRKRARCSDLEPNSSSKVATGLRLFWWRGGRLSRQLFNWKALPRTLVSKAARQGGCKKIPGILYPDSSEFAKRSKYVVWRASVETSRSIEQLALQVRELDANIRWDSIENTDLLSMMDKASRKSIRSFKKVIIRRKCSEGTVVKYLLDFGKRRFIPDIVERHGSMLEESSSGRTKYWLEESYVPLHLLKVFEERRIARKSNEMSSGKRHESGRVIKTPSKMVGFSYLFSKAERSENYQCEHCYKDVLIREAVSCQYCKGFIHKRHVKKSGGAITAECTYTCHKCQDGKSLKIDTKKGKSQLQKNKKASKVVRQVHAKISRKPGKDKQPAQSQNNGKDSVLPLRRSSRKVKYDPMQSKIIGGSKKGKQTKFGEGISKKPNEDTWQKKRTRMYHSYWLNGLLLSRKPNDERGMDFRSGKLLAPSKQLTAILEQPKCGLCCEPAFTSTLTYIGCEICGDWFHGDAFRLGAENIGNLIGFKCHMCRNRTPPLCPHFHAMTSDESLLG